jgi:aryl-alcohol dehydrogenase-like predicted oxidoreductase
VDALDLFQLNKPSVAQLANGEAFDTLARLKAAGKIRYAGVVIGDVASGDACLRSDVVDAIQVLYNLLVTDTESLMRAAAADGLLVVARSPLNSGVLSGTYTPSTTFPADDERSGYLTGDAFVARMRAVTAIQAELGVDGTRLLTLALAYVLANPDVSTVIPGASSLAQAREYLACAAAPRPGADERARISRIVECHLGGIPRVFQN